MGFNISSLSAFEFDLGETSFENIFIKHFLPYADEIQIKVYLLGMYYAKNRQETSISSLAKELDLPESSVFDALQYWENQNALAIVNTDGELGVSFYSLRTQVLKGTSSKNCISNPARELVEMVNSITGRTLSGAEYTFYENFRKETGGSTDILKTVLTLYYKDLNKSDFGELRNYLNSILKTRNFDLEYVAVQANHFFHRNKFYKRVKTLIGGKTEPTPPEQKMINDWLDNYGMKEEEIIRFIELQSPNTNNPTIGYINKAIVQQKSAPAADPLQEEMLKRFKFEITGTRYAVTKGERRVMLSWLQELGLSEDEILAEIDKYSPMSKGATVSDIDERIRGISNGTSSKRKKKKTSNAPDFVDEDLEALISQREAGMSNGHK